MGNTTPKLVLYRPAVGETGWGTLVDGNFTVLDDAVVATPDVALKGLVDLSDPVAGQIKFPAAQHASADANTLDDYEEGTWIPVVGGTATYTTQVGTYTKIGRQVTVICQLKINVLGTGSTSTVGNFPFAALGYATGALHWLGGAISPVYAVMLVSPGGVTAASHGILAGNGTLSLIGLLRDSAELRFTLTYFV